jgi:hypothetical protein
VAKKGVGTIIGRRSVSKGREYTRVWIYIPTKISEDTAFPFEISDPCAVEIDLKQNRLVIEPISKERAFKLGWQKRERRQA